MKLWASSEATFGNKLRPWRVRFSTTRSSESSVYSMRGIGMYPTYNYKLRFKSQVKKGETYMFNQLGYDHPPNIIPEVGFEFQAAFAIEQEITGEPSPVLPEAFVDLLKISLVRFGVE